MVIFDIETNGFEDDSLNLEEINTIHVIALYDSEQKEVMVYDNDKIPEALKILSEADCLCGHNVIHFDMPVLRKLGGGLIFTTNIIDTLVLGRVAYPDIYEFDMVLWKQGKLPAELIKKHSLESWGYRLGMFKGNFRHEGDFSKWSPEMSEYCKQDVSINVALYNKLMTKGLTQETIELENQVAEIIRRQMWHGFKFDVPKAENLYASLIGKREELTNTLRQVFKPWYVGKEFTPKKDDKKVGYRKGCTLTQIKLVEFKPSSRAHIAKKLKEYFGWSPAKYTDNGTPILDETVISALPYPEAKLIGEYLTINKRIGQLAEGNEAWLKQVKKDGRLHGFVNPNGAVTGRMTHSKPNMAQVPKVGNPYGEECRELFTVKEGYRLVGIDASGLELRCLAHYIAYYDGGKYAETILTGDIHSANQAASGLPTRDKAKRFIYAFLYGAGNELLGSIIGKGKAAGASIRTRFLKKTVGLNDLVTAIQTKAKSKGYIIGIDGRKLKVRSLHSVLNLLLQSAGALVMKRAMVILDDTLRCNLVAGVDYEFVGNIHDEWQMEVKEELADYVGKTAVRAIRQAGEAFKFRCPLDGEYKVGDNWANTH